MNESLPYDSSFRIQLTAHARILTGFYLHFESLLFLLFVVGQCRVGLFGFSRVDGPLIREVNWLGFQEKEIFFFEIAALSFVSSPVYYPGRLQGVCAAHVLLDVAPCGYLSLFVVAWFARYANTWLLAHGFFY